MKKFSPTRKNNSNEKPEWYCESSELSLSDQKWIWDNIPAKPQVSQRISKNRDIQRSMVTQKKRKEKIMPSEFGKPLPWENKSRSDHSWLKSRILKGIDYFWNIKPSEFNAGQKLLLTEFLKLLKEYLNKSDH